MNMAKSKPSTPKRTGRAKPMVPKAGVTRTHRRYGCGGKLKNKNLYKVFLIVLKVLPITIALLAALNTITAFFAIDLMILSYIGGISFLSIIFMYISSYVFNFCVYHRIFLDYAVINNIINIIDLYIGIPITDLGMLCVQMILLFLVLIIALILYLKRKQNGS